MTEEEKRAALIEKFSRIQNIIWIEGVLERPMKVARNVTAGFRPPACLGQPDSMFAGNDSAPRQYSCEQFIACCLNLLAHGDFAIVAARHDIAVTLAVSL